MKKENQYFELRDNGRCLRIKTPETPLPWENFLYTADGKYTMRMTQRGVSKTLYNYGANHVSDGKNFCIKDCEDQKIWSLNGGESADRPEKYYCDFLPGRIIFHSSNNGINTKLTVAVDPFSYLEVYSLVIENSTAARKKIQLTSCDFINLEGIDNTQQLEETKFDEETGALLCQRIYSRTADNKYASFFVADMKPDSFCGSNFDFYGRDCSFADAAAWETEDLPNANAYAFKTLLALRYGIDLKPGESMHINFGSGIADDFADAKSKAVNFLNNKLTEKVLESNYHFFKELTKEDELVSPDWNIDAMYNIWNRIQLHWQNSCGRGGGTHNWRNNLQDGMGWLIIDPFFARKRLTEICSLAKSDGFMQRSTPKLPDGPVNNQKHTDIATWAVLCAARYAKETGDIDFFKEQVDYASGQKRDTIAGCLVNGVKWLLDHRGQHGMILLLEGDWSDPLEEAGRRGIGESPWTSVALINAIKEFVPVLEKIGMEKVADELLSESKSLTEAVNKHAWDGKWYIRGITDDGIKFCTQDDPDANVSLMMQAWSIISGIVPEDRLEKVISSLDKNCKTELGPILYGPPFLKERPELGRESVKRPGTGENGSCYTHAGMMLAWAENVIRRPEEALKIMKHFVPMRPEFTDIALASPTWWSNYYQGPHAAFPGRSSNIISSGAPAWFMMNVSEGLLGIIPTFEGLKICPNLPKSWNEVKFTRKWLGSLYRFEFTRAETQDKCKVFLDGVEIDGNIIKPQPRSKEYKIKVIF
jgi:cellobionic acid phosphorylase